MEDIYRAKHSFCGVTREKNSKNNCEFFSITRSMPTSPNSSRTVKYQTEKLCQINKPEKTKMCEAILRSPGLNAKLEKSNSEPNVFDGNPSKLNNYNSSMSNSNQVPPSLNATPFEDSLAGVSSANNAESLFLSFQEGDLFQVLSKEEHKNWWAVRSVKQNTVGFVPANYMQLTESAASEVFMSAATPPRQPPEEALADLRARVAAAASTAAAVSAARAAATAASTAAAAAAAAAATAAAAAVAAHAAHDSGDAESAGVDAADAAAVAVSAADADADADALFPDGMIPEPELCRGGAGAGAADLDRRNRRNHGAAPPAAPPLPPPPPFSAEGLILPRKLHNPCLESNDHKNLHRELLFNQKVGKNVLNQKSELQKAFGKHKEQQVRKELEQQRQNSKSDFERMVEERARRMDLLEKERSEDSDKCSQGESEFLKVHAKMRARMDSK